MLLRQASRTNQEIVLAGIHREVVVREVQKLIGPFYLQAKRICTSRLPFVNFNTPVEFPLKLIDRASERPVVNKPHSIILSSRNKRSDYRFANIVSSVNDN